MFDPGFWSPVCFALCFVVMAVFALLVHVHKGVLVGFTMMAALSFFLINLSGLFITNIFFLDGSHISADHIPVFLYTLGGLVAFAAGVWLAWTPLRNKSSLVNPFAVDGNLVILFLVFGVIVLFFARFLPFVPTISSFLYRLSGLVQLGFLAAIVWTLERSDYARLAIAATVFFPVALLNVAITGFSGMMGMFILHPCILILFRRRIDPVRVGAFALFVYSFFVLASVWLSTRSLIREDMLRAGSALDRSIEFYGEFGRAARDSLATPEVLQAAAVARVDLSVYNALQVGYLSATGGYSYGKSLFIDPILALVPRLIWKGKTITLGDSEFINQYTGLGLSNDSISVDTNMTFEFYANFGWFGVIAGMFVFGFTIARMELALFRPGIRLRWVVVISVLLLSLSSGGRRAAAMALELGTSGIGAYILGWCLEKSGAFVRVFQLQRLQGAEVGRASRAIFARARGRAAPKRLP